MLVTYGKIRNTFRNRVFSLHMHLHFTSGRMGHKAVPYKFRVFPAFLRGKAVSRMNGKESAALLHIAFEFLRAYLRHSIIKPRRIVSAVQHIPFRVHYQRVPSEHFRRENVLGILHKIQLKAFLRQESHPFFHHFRGMPFVIA